MNNKSTSTRTGNRNNSIQLAAGQKKTGGIVYYLIASLIGIFLGMELVGDPTARREIEI
ncbi:MAG TPA: hypothetical protein VMS73_01860 [Anaerolineaceae bacterium]|nr:hypothetical protein [Anaerolineaceae bacterium]